MAKNEVDYNAQVLFDYHFLKQPLKKSDAILVLGSHDPSVADYAVQLYKEGWASKIIFSGGVIRPIGELRNTTPKSEAEAFFDIAVQQGIPAADVLLENDATNTGENFSCTIKLLYEKNLTFKSFILVQKPYMVRRTYATALVQFADFDFMATAMPDTYESYLARCASNGIGKERVISNMTGDLQRLKVYPEKGFLVAMEIPEEVWSAYEKLIELGFEGRMANTAP
jgi:uncharacterized SAM-binding protein YcdF (DUF218 family)